MLRDRRLDWGAGGRLLVASGILALLVALAYANSFQADWHYDDRPNIVENPYVRITSLAPAALLRAMVQDRGQNRPFSSLSFALNYYFNGEKVRGYHFVNLVLHFFSALAGFGLLRLTFRRANLAPDRQESAALAAAAVWAVHPIQTQAVTYIVQRQTLMASAFMLLTLFAYAAGRQSSGARKMLLYALAGLAFILALGSKEIALVTPLLVLLYEIYFFQNFSFAFLRRHPLALALALLAFVAFLLGFARPAMFANLLQGYQAYPFTLSQRLLTEPRVLWQYLDLLILPWPSRLSVEHDPALSTSWFSPWTTLPAILVWLSLLAGALRSARRRPLLSFALLWYLLNLSLESSFVPLDLMFEHRLYLPSLAVIAPVVAGMVFSTPRLRATLVSLGLLVLVLLVSTQARNRVWRTDPGLWRDCVKKAPFLASSSSNLGGAYAREGQPRRAIALYHRAIQLDPQYAMAYYNLGAAWQQLGETDQALAAYSRALERNPNLVPASYNRGNLYFRQGRFELAIADYSRAVAANPNYAWAYGNRGTAHLNLGHYQQAVADFSRSLQLNPDDAGDYLNRGNAYRRLGREDLARADFEKARELDPRLFPGP